MVAYTPSLENQENREHLNDCKHQNLKHNDRRNPLCAFRNRLKRLVDRVESAGGTVPEIVVFSVVLCLEERKWTICFG